MLIIQTSIWVKKTRARIWMKKTEYKPHVTALDRGLTEAIPTNACNVIAVRD
jgi:hypothetical protein